MRGLPLLILGCVGASLFALPGCGSGSSGESDPGAALGEACVDGSDCKNDLFCFAEVDGEPGKCEAIPAACSGDPSCTGGCFDDFKAKCTTGSACLSIGGSVTVSCSKPM